MLIYVEQDIFKSPAQVIVNTVNTVGVMGKGISKRFKGVYPDMFKEYRNFCELGSLTMGSYGFIKQKANGFLISLQKSIGEILLKLNTLKTD